MPRRGGRDRIQRCAGRGGQGFARSGSSAMFFMQCTGAYAACAMVSISAQNERSCRRSGGRVMITHQNYGDFSCYSRMSKQSMMAMFGHGSYARSSGDAANTTQVSGTLYFFTAHGFGMNVEDAILMLGARFATQTADFVRRRVLSRSKSICGPNTTVWNYTLGKLEQDKWSRGYRGWETGDLDCDLWTPERATDLAGLQTAIATAQKAYSEICLFACRYEPAFGMEVLEEKDRIASGDHK